MSKVATLIQKSMKDIKTLENALKKFPGVKMEKNAAVKGYRGTVYEKNADIVLKGYQKLSWGSQDIGFKVQADGTIKTFCDDGAWNKKGVQDMNDEILLAYSKQDAIETLERRDLPVTETTQKCSKTGITTTTIEGVDYAGQGVRFTINHAEPAVISMAMIGYTGEGCEQAAIASFLQNATVKSFESTPDMDSARVNPPDCNSLDAWIDEDHSAPCG